jgi:rhodanese-related sulfurtransferase
MGKIQRNLYARCKSIPLNELPGRLHEIDSTKSIVVFCQTGKRSIVAANELLANLKHQHIYSISGGINAIDQN